MRPTSPVTQCERKMQWRNIESSIQGVCIQDKMDKKKSCDCTCCSFNHYRQEQKHARASRSSEVSKVHPPLPVRLKIIDCLNNIGKNCIKVTCLEYTGSHFSSSSNFLLSFPGHFVGLILLYYISVGFSIYQYFIFSIVKLSLLHCLV